MARRSCIVRCVSVRNGVAKFRDARGNTFYCAAVQPTGHYTVGGSYQKTIKMQQHGEHAEMFWRAYEK